MTNVRVTVDRETGEAFAVPPRRRREMWVMSPRQLEVLQALADGLTYPQMAERLFMARTSVSKTLGRLYVRLGVSSGPEAVHVAYQRGILRVPCGRCGG